MGSGGRGHVVVLVRTCDVIARETSLCACGDGGRGILR